jgi:hypothetical protein
MLRLVFLPAALLHLAVIARAGLVHDLVPVDNSAVVPGDDSQVPDFNDGSYFTFDLVVLVIGVDDWQGAGIDATISGPATFFQHPIGGDVPPDASLIAMYPAVEFDSYFAGAPGTIPGFADGPYNEPNSISADWFDSETTGFDQYPVARFTVQWSGGEEASLTVQGQSGAASTHLPWPFDFTVTIPEPSALSILILGALAGFRRQRWV